MLWARTAHRERWKKSGAWARRALAAEEQERWTKPRRLRRWRPERWPVERVLARARVALEWRRPGSRSEIQVEPEQRAQLREREHPGGSHPPRKLRDRLQIRPWARLEERRR